MPLFDFRCPKCNAVREVFCRSYAASAEEVKCSAKVLTGEGDSCDCDWCNRTCDTVMEKVASAPATFRVNGYNALNHYGAKVTDTATRGEKLIGARGRGMKVTTHEAT